MARSLVLVIGLIVACDSGSNKVDDSTDALAQATWYQDVGPILLDKCGACHKDGGIGGFSMERYEDAVPWADAILDAIDTGRMPPWAARVTESCDPPVWFKDDPRPNDDDIALVRAWIENDTAEGEPLTLEVPAGPGLTDVQTKVTLQAPFEVSGDRDIYQCFRVEVPHDQDVWITGLEVIAGNDLVVHHALVWNDPENQSLALVDEDGNYPCSGEPEVWPTDLIGGWTPGAPPIESPENTGTLFKAGASLVVNMHYHPTGNTTELDQTSFKLRWTTEKPAQYTTFYLVDIPFGAEVQPGPNDTDGAEFLIPAGLEEHKETVVLDTYDYLPFDVPIFGVMPHMHYRGVDMQVFLEHDSDPEDTCLVHTPDYRFDFQQIYSYDGEISDMPVLKTGGRVRVECVYNNSESNPFMDEALAATGDTSPIDVRWGEETGDEMCMAIVGMVLPPIDLSDWL